MVPLVTGHCAQALSSWGPMAAPRALPEASLGYQAPGPGTCSRPIAELSWETIRPLGMTCTLVRRGAESRKKQARAPQPL